MLVTMKLVYSLGDLENVELVCAALALDFVGSFRKRTPRRVVDIQLLVRCIVIFAFEWLKECHQMWLVVSGVATGAFAVS